MFRGWLTDLYACIYPVQQNNDISKFLDLDMSLFFDNIGY